MKIEEAIKNLEKEMKCQKEECLGQCQEGKGGCPYFVSFDASTESLQVIVEWYKNMEQTVIEYFNKNKEKEFVNI